jgi:hypothetical protein
MIHLAFLAPDIVTDILNGVQPLGLNSEWLRRATCLPGGTLSAA